MPAVTSGKVLVTGANGFIAGWIMKDLLEHGYSVRGTVRAADKANGIRDALAASADRLEFVVVEPGAFDDAVKDMDAIIHVASPVHFRFHDPQEIIRPAVNGTTSILRSASSAPDASIKRVVYVSSLAAVVHDHRSNPTAPFTEADWNDTDPALVAEKGADAHPSVVYRTSKTLAERASWDFFAARSTEGTIGWDLVSLCPPWVFGPTLGAQTPKDLGTSGGQWFTSVVKEEGELPAWSIGPSWTDVRDFADAALRALIKPEAGGERFIICAGPFAWSQWVSIARRMLGKGDIDDSSVPAALPPVYDAKKSQQVLGMNYRSMEETAEFMIEDFKAKGWC